MTARNTCATLLLHRGAHPEVVIELLGHSAVAMSLDQYWQYSHILLDVQQAALEAMAALAALEALEALEALDGILG
jgi:site-specific recombinase XerD